MSQHQPFPVNLYVRSQNEDFAETNKTFYSNNYRTVEHTMKTNRSTLIPKSPPATANRTIKILIPSFTSEETLKDIKVGPLFA